MIWKSIVGSRALAPRRRIVAAAIVYGLSLAVRFTSATGEEIQVPARYVQTTKPMISVPTRDGAQLPYADWSLNNAQAAFYSPRFRRTGTCD